MDVKKEPSSLDASIRWGSRCVDDIYETQECVGQGTYGYVYRAQDKLRKETVALKLVRMDNEKEGFPITAIREIKLLKQLKHPNIVELKEIVTNKDKSGIYMVFEYMEHDLSGLLEAGYVFSIETTKCYMKQLLEGLHFCHANNVLHRDIKASNLLINNKGQLKLADFGLARSFNSNSQKFTNRVITRWYRPPELLLGATKYGTEVDMWSVGCIFFELLQRRPLFPGRDDIDQLDRIFKLCGVPTEENWPGFSELKGASHFLSNSSSPSFSQEKRPLREKYGQIFGEDAIELLDAFLTLDPAKRISAHDALYHKYFWSKPLPANPSDIQPYEQSCHDMAKRKRRQSGNGTQIPPPAIPPPATATTSTTTTNTQQPLPTQMSVPTQQMNQQLQPNRSGSMISNNNNNNTNTSGYGMRQNQHQQHFTNHGQYNQYPQSQPQQIQQQQPPQQQHYDHTHHQHQHH